jgi:hypothetical protein
MNHGLMTATLIDCIAAPMADATVSMSRSVSVMASSYSRGAHTPVAAASRA